MNSEYEYQPLNRHLWLSFQRLSPIPHKENILDYQNPRLLKMIKRKTKIQIFKPK